MTPSERRIYERLKRGPASAMMLAHAARCRQTSIKVLLSRIRSKTGEKIVHNRWSLEYKIISNPDKLPINR